MISCRTYSKIEVTITQLSNGSKDARVQTPYIGYLNPVTSDETKNGERIILRTGADNGKELSIFSLKIPAVGLAHLSVMGIGNQTLTTDVNCDPSSQK